MAIYGLVRFLQDEEIFEHHSTDLRHVTHLFERGSGGHIASEGRKERAKGTSRERPYKLVDAKGRGKSWLPVHRCVRTSRSTQTPSTRQRAFRRRRKANRKRLSCSTPTNRRCSRTLLVSLIHLLERRNGAPSPGCALPQHTYLPLTPSNIIDVSSRERRKCEFRTSTSS